MQKTLYIIRHCQAAGQVPDAPLTPAGEQQAIHLADQLAALPIERIISSPYARAVRSIQPLAQRLALPIVTDARLTERVLSTSAIADWMTALRATFDDLALCYVDGESSRAATQRAVAVLDDVIAHAARATVIVTHGNLMTLLLKDFDPSIGFADWQQLRNPDVYCVTLGGAARPQRM